MGGGEGRRFGSHGRMCVTVDHSLSLLDSMIHDFSSLNFSMKIESIDTFHWEFSIHFFGEGFYSSGWLPCFIHLAAAVKQTKETRGKPSSVLDNVPGGRHWNTHTWPLTDGGFREGGGGGMFTFPVTNVFKLSGRTTKLWISFAGFLCSALMVVAAGTSRLEQGAEPFCKVKSETSLMTCAAAGQQLLVNLTDCVHFTICASNLSRRLKWMKIIFFFGVEKSVCVIRVIKLTVKQPRSHEKKKHTHKVSSSHGVTCSLSIGQTHHSVAAGAAGPWIIPLTTCSEERGGRCFLKENFSTFCWGGRVLLNGRPPLEE